MPDAKETFSLIYDEFPEICMVRGRTTEADTRANILDRVIHECLGWSRENVRRETNANPGYIDYVCSHGLPCLVWEAKSSGTHFHFPHTKNKRRRLKLDGVLAGDAETWAAIVQAQRYAIDTGIRFAVVSNGYSYIVFRAITEGTSWKSGHAIVFHDRNDVTSHFADFWDTLSFEAVRDGLLDRAFRNDILATRDYEVPLASMVAADALYARNQLNVAIQPYVDKLFGDIAKQDSIDVLNHCYVHSRPVHDIDANLQLSITDSIPTFASGAQQVHTTEQEQAGTFGRDLHTGVSTRGLRGQLVVLMGGIGCGKSTFCRRFFRVVAPTLVARNGPGMLVYLDFLGAPDTPDQLDRFLWQRAERALLNAEPLLGDRAILELIFSDKLQVIRDIFEEPRDQLESRIKEELFKLRTNPRDFCEAALAYSAREARLPIVVCDNVDQLSHPAQVEIFSAAHRLATTLQTTCIVVLREESYSAAIFRKHLTAHTVRPFHLSSPPFRTLIKLRIDLAVHDAVRAARTSGATKTEQEYGSIVQLFSLLRGSIFGNNKNIVRLVESIAYGNMRLALELFNRFITSGATNISKIIATYNRWGGYTVPFHEFVKSVMLGDYRYYKESRSPIVNVFAVTRRPNASHMTTLRVLSYISNARLVRGGFDGFVGLQEVILGVSDVFDNDEDCKETILRLIAVGRQLLELDTRRSDGFDGAAQIRITASGTYYRTQLVNSFSYLDLVWIDTPFADRATSETLARQADEVDMRARFSRVERFLDYLEQQEHQELTGRGLLSNTGFWGPFLPYIKEQYFQERALIARKLRIPGIGTIREATPTVPPKATQLQSRPIS